MGGGAGSRKDQDKRLFQTFKIKALGVGSNNNLFSDKSLTKVCGRSRHSLEDLAIKNAIHLTNNSLLENLSILTRLQRLDLSYTKQIDDVVVKSVAMNVRNLKKLCLRFLGEITGESVALALENLKLLEGVDISGCFKVNLDTLMSKFRDNRSLRCLLLEYLFTQPYHLYHLKHSNLETLSLFCKSFS